VNADRPFFRTDLVSRPLDDGGKRFVEVTDPDSGNSFRFYEIEYAIACAMDGERDVDELCEWAKVELGLEPSAEELQVVIGTLGDLGYLEGIGAAGETQPQAPVSTSPAVATPPAMPRMPAAAAGGVTRGWDVQAPPRDDIDLGAPGKAKAPAAGGVTRGWDVQSPDEVELGFAGKSPVAEPRRGNEPRAAAGEFELGSAGNKGLRDPDAVSFETTPTGQTDIHDRLTRPQAAMGGDYDSDVSTDLSDHIPLAASDVKEAVRASKVMSAVEPREEDTLVEPGDVGKKTVMGWQAPVIPPAPAAPARSHVTVQKQPVATPPTSTPVRGPSQAAVVLPEKPAEISRPIAVPQEVRQAHAQVDRHPTAEKKSIVLPLLLVLLLLAAAGGGAYWYFVLRDKGEGAGETGAAQPAGDPGPTDPAGGTATPTEPPPEPEITAMLEAGPNDEKTVAAPRNGRIAWLAEAGSEVAEGAPIAKIAGFEGWERLLTSSVESQRRYQERLDQATSKGDKSAMKQAEADVKRKQVDIDKAKAELEKYVVTSPIGGVLEPVVEAKAAAKKDQPVAKILAQSGPRATFKLPAGRSQLSGGEVQVASKADPSLRATCKVDSAEGQTIVVTCPTDSGLAAGSEVVLK
jgi:hypothetical protein